MDAVTDHARESKAITVVGPKAIKKDDRQLSANRDKEWANDEEILLRMISLNASGGDQEVTITLTKGPEISLRTAVCYFKILQHLHDQHADDFSAVIRSVGTNQIPDTKLFHTLRSVGIIREDKFVSDFLDVLKSSIWEIESGVVELIIPLPANAKAERDLWDKEMAVCSDFLQRFGEGPQDDTRQEPFRR
jgi:hypothetical protein